MLRYPVTSVGEGAVALRRWELTDLALVEEAAADPLLLPGTTLPRSFTADEGQAFIERQWSRQTTGEGLSLVITYQDVPVGCATLMTRRPAVGDLGYWLVERARGLGVATKAIGSLVDWALGEASLEAVEAYVAEDNTASRRLLDRLDFLYVGRRRHQVNQLDEVLLLYRREGA